MFRTYLKIAFRHLTKSTFHTSINILGLSIGIGFTLLIGAFVWTELQVNRSLHNRERQYIVQSRWKDPNMGLEMTTIGPLVKALREQYPGLVKNFYRWDGITSNVSKADKVFREGLQLGDSTLLQMYGFTLLYGEPRTALRDPYTLVITEDRAVKYFGRKDVVGETLTIESFSGSKHDFKITGVLKQPAANSVTHLTPENDNQFYIPEASIAYFGRTVDDWNSVYTAGYVELQPGIRPEALRQPMQDLVRKHATSQIAANLTPFLSPLTTYYLNQNDGLVKRMLLTVSVIALFILAMAIINFVNITIGKSSSRIKEIGVRKVMGSQHRQLIFQFLLESVLLVTMATLVAFVIYTAARPFLADVLGKDIPALHQFPFTFVAVPVLFILVVGVLAGIYPAFVLARLKAAESVKGKLQSVPASIFLRKTLVGFQICTASVVFIGAIVTMQQVSLFFGRDIGYNKDYVVSLQVPRNWSPEGVQKMLTVRNEFESMPEVLSASLCWTMPDGQGSGTTLLYPSGKDSTHALPHDILIADENYLDVFKVPVKAGRYLRHQGDSLNVVMNESAVMANGWKTAEEAIGKDLFFPGNFKMTVVGVTKDFQLGSMKDKIKPALFTHPSLNNLYRTLAFRLQPGRLTASIEAIQKRWNLLLPGTAFEYRFMDESLQRLYASEIRLRKALQIALGLALVIVMLGISGLVSISIHKRTKEVGVRKVIGASAYNILALFIKEFLPVVIAGGLISVPLAWYLMQSWLQHYATRIQLSAAPFAMSIGAIVFVAVSLMTLQLLRIARENPVKNLRTE